MKRCASYMKKAAKKHSEMSICNYDQIYNIETDKYIFSEVKIKYEKHNML